MKFCLPIAAKTEISGAKEEIQKIDAEYKELKTVRNAATERRKYVPACCFSV